MKLMLLKAMEEYNCSTKAEWEDLLDVVNMMKNRLMIRNGYSPIQRVLGYAPRIPGGLVSSDMDDHALPSQVRLGDRSAEKGMLMRQAAAKVFMEADCSEALRRAIASGPRHDQEFDIGEIVYFYRMGPDKARKFNAG